MLICVYLGWARGSQHPCRKSGAAVVEGQPQHPLPQSRPEATAVSSGGRRPQSGRLPLSADPRPGPVSDAPGDRRAQRLPGVPAAAAQRRLQPLGVPALVPQPPRPHLPEPASAGDRGRRQGGAGRARLFRRPPRPQPLVRPQEQQSEQDGGRRHELREEIALHRLCR